MEFLLKAKQSLERYNANVLPIIQSHLDINDKNKREDTT